MNARTPPQDFDTVDYLTKFFLRVDQSGIPATASIEITERCNLRCVHCYLGDQDALRKERTRELSTEQWLNRIDQIAELGCLRLLITGGDPMLRSDFISIYTHARKKGLLVTVFTNGTLVTPDIIEAFREFPPYAVEITQYGASQETFDRVVAKQGAYARYMRGIEQLRDLGVNLRLKTVVMEPNRHEFQEIAKISRKLGSESFRFDIEVQGEFQGSFTPQMIRLSPEEAVEVEFSDPERLEDWRDYWERRKDLKPGYPDRLYNCGASRGTFHINPYGGLQPCVTTRHISMDTEKLTVRGALEAVREILDKKKAPQGRACNTCEHRMVCNSCPAFSVLEHGDEARPAEFQCRVTQARVAFLKTIKESPR